MTLTLLPRSLEGFLQEFDEWHPGGLLLRMSVRNGRLEGSSQHPRNGGLEGCCKACEEWQSRGLLQSM
jgi:hypothetical protein